MLAVDAVIRRRLHTEVVLVRQVSDYIIGSGGKRLRPILVILGAGACGHRGPDFTQEATVYNISHAFGWVTTVEDLMKALKSGKH